MKTTRRGARALRASWFTGWALLVVGLIAVPAGAGAASARASRIIFDSPDLCLTAAVAMVSELKYIPGLGLVPIVVAKADAHTYVGCKSPRLQPDGTDPLATEKVVENIEIRLFVVVRYPNNEIRGCHSVKARGDGTWQTSAQMSFVPSGGGDVPCRGEMVYAEAEVSAYDFRWSRKIGRIYTSEIRLP